VGRCIAAVPADFLRIWRQTGLSEWQAVNLTFWVPGLPARTASRRGGDPWRRVFCQGGLALNCSRKDPGLINLSASVLDALMPVVTAGVGR
jgi:hypothetical protein